MSGDPDDKVDALPRSMYMALHTDKPPDHPNCRCTIVPTEVGYASYRRAQLPSLQLPILPIPSLPQLPKLPIPHIPAFSLDFVFVGIDTAVREWPQVVPQNTSPADVWATMARVTQGQAKGFRMSIQLNRPGVQADTRLLVVFRE